MTREHTWYFESSEQTTEGRAALDSVLLTKSLVKMENTRLIFQTPYPLGPVTRSCLFQQAQPTAVYWNRQPDTGKKFPLSRRMTREQCCIIIAAIAITNLFLSQNGYAWDHVLAGIWLVLLVAWVSSDLDGFVKSLPGSGINR